VKQTYAATAARQTRCGAIPASSRLLIAYSVNVAALYEGVSYIDSVLPALYTVDILALR